MAGTEVFAAVTDRAPGWLAGTVTRPRLWGIGIALLGLFAVSVSRPLVCWGPAEGGLGEAARICMLLIGLALMWRGRR